MKITTLSLFMSLSLLLLNIGCVPAPEVIEADDGKIGMVSITFDDGFLNNYENAYPILESKNTKATFYVVGDRVGDVGYMSKAQLMELQSKGHEIGSHSSTHPLLTTVLNSDNLLRESKGSLETLTNMGLNVTNFATPYGDYNNKVLAQLTKNYRSHRGFHDRDDLNTFPYNNTVLMVQSVQRGVTLKDISYFIDKAKNEKKWLILVFHSIDNNPDPNDPDYDYFNTSEDLAGIIDYIKESRLPIRTIEEELSLAKESIILGDDFANNPLINGWSTNSPSRISFDQGNNGEYPNSLNSIKMEADPNQNVYLFSSKVDIDVNLDYYFKAFVNATDLNGANLGFFIDEYDINGNWISGKYLGVILPGKINQYSFPYTTSSVNVSKISLQAFIDTGSTGHAYIDNMKLFKAKRSVELPHQP